MGIDSVQLVLLIVIIILAVIFVVLGIQVFFILKELKNTLAKTNKILDEVESLTESISEPVSFISGLLFSSKTFASIINFIRKGRGKKSE